MLTHTPDEDFRAFSTRIMGRFFTAIYVANQKNAKKVRLVVRPYTPP